MSRVAIVFFGHFRTFPYVQDSFKAYVMDPLGADIFFVSPTTYFAPKTVEVPEYHWFHSASDRVIGNELIDFFGSGLKDYRFEDYTKQFFVDRLKQNGVPDRDYANQYTFRMAAQLHARQLSINLFRQYIEKHNVQYDIVIMARGDVKYYTTFNILALDMGKINYPTHAWHNDKKDMSVLSPFSCPSDKLHKAFNDQMLAGPQKEMLSYCDIYDKSFEYFKNRIHYNTETQLGHHLLKNNIDWCGGNFIEYELWRHEKY